MLITSTRAFPIKRVLMASLLFASAVSSILFVEPAPYDLLILLLFSVCLSIPVLEFSAQVRIPTFFLIIFVGANLISAFSAQEVPRGILYLTITLYLIASWIFFVGIVSKYKQIALVAIFNGYIIAASISSLFGMLAFTNVLPPVYPFIFAERVTGLFKDPNVFGPFLAVGLLYALLRLETAGRFKTRVIWLLLICFFSLGIFLSFSRGAWLNSIVSVTIYLLLSEKMHINRLLALFVVGSLVTTSIYAYISYNPTTQQIFVQRLGLQGYDQERFGNQAVALSESAIHPLGFGAGQSEVLLSKATHSLYLRVLYENGWLGFFSFASFIAVTLFRSLRIMLATGKIIRKYHLLFFAATIGVLVNSLVIDSLHWRHFWLLLALPWAVYED